MSLFTQIPRLRLGVSCYPTADAMFFDAHDRRKTIVAPISNAKYVKPYFLSNYKYMNHTVISSGTFHILDAATNPYLGILAKDSTCGDAELLIIGGNCWLPVHSSYATEAFASNAIIGKTAYLVTEGENWGVTDDLDGKDGIVIGRFVNRVHFRPNGIRWGDRFVGVRLDDTVSSQNSPITVSENTSGTCDFGCRISAFPFVESSNGKTVTINSNIFVLNPDKYELNEIRWNFSGDTESVVDVNGDTVTRLINEARGNRCEETFTFDAYDTYAVTVTAFATKKSVLGSAYPDSGSDCGCDDCNGCCIIKEFTVIVSDSGATICTPNFIPTGIRTDYKVTYSYTDAAAATADKVTGITLGGTSYPFTAGIAMSSGTAIQDAIKAILTGKTLFGDVVVDYVAAPTNGDTATLFVTITDMDTVLVPTSIQMNLNNGGSTPSSNFVAI